MQKGNPEDPLRFKRPTLLSVINEGKSWRSLKIQETNTPICDFDYGRNFGTHNYVHLQSAFPIKQKSGRSDIFSFDSHPTYDMDSDEE